MKKTLAILAVLALTLPFTGCEKEEDNDGMIEIFAEAMNGGTKVLLDGANATWVDGEKIRINSDEATVERRGDRAYISYASSQEVNRALYPSSLNVTSWGGDNVTVTFPSYYHYRTDGAGHQILDLPMAARSEGSNPLQFKHLTGALYITITNTASVPLTLQSVTVTSNNYMLNGSRAINLSAIDTIGARISGSNARKSVSLLFDTGYELAASGGNVKVMIPVMPVGSDNRFTISVKSYKDGNAKSYLYSRQQSESGDHSLARNELGYAPVSIVASGATADVLEKSSGMYLVRTPHEFAMMLKAIDNQWFSATAKYNILEDLDMTGIPITPILYTGFSGYIYGNNNTISHLTINGITVGGEHFCGLFKCANLGMTIQDITFNDLRLINQNVGSSTLYAGGLIAQNTSSGSATLTINNCTFSIGSFDDGGATGNVYFGGIVGELSSVEARLTNCHVTMSPLSIGGANIWFGGVIGYMGTKPLSLSQSSWEGMLSVNASGNIYIGGFAGYKSYMSAVPNITNCSVDGYVDAYSLGNNRYIGALIGGSSTEAFGSLSGTTTNFTASLNGHGVSINNYGTNLAK